MMKYRSYVAAGILTATSLFATNIVAAADPDFQQDILPLLADRCFACHGPDANQRKADLRLDLEEGARKEALVPGRPDESELFRRISSTDPDERMPPPDSEKPPLTPEEVALFRAWIAGGATWAGHWAYTAPRPADPPSVSNTVWPRNEIDNFVLARLETAGLAPSPEASRETLIRRLSFDLTGLPPSLDAIDAFVMDHSDNAYERLVDRLLASPAYGEHMARSWLDGARYADTNGYQNDFHRVMWPWRDWVIGAFNDNMPYDQFVLEQIAGDLLPGATESQRIATGFNRNNKSVTEGGSIEEEWLVENLVDRVETTSTVFLGLTTGCARCHDHKYDPISQRDFYSFYAFFNSTEDKGFYQETRGNTGPQVMLPTFEQQRELAKLDATVSLMRQGLEASRAEAGGDYGTWLAGLKALDPATVPAPVVGWALDGSVSETGTDPEGIRGPALALDGTPETTLDLGESITFDRERPFSIVFWARPESDGAFVSKMDEANAYRGIDVLVSGNGAVEVHVVSTWDTDALKVTAGDALKMGAWNHVGVTYDGSGKAAGVTIVTNGVKTAGEVVKDGLTGSIATAEPLRVGQRTGSAYLKGAVADLRVFDTALSTEAIRAVIAHSLGSVLPPEVPKEQDKLLRGYFEQQLAQRVKPDQDAYDMAVKARAQAEQKVPSVMVMQEREEPRPTYLLKRGAYDAPDTSEVLTPRPPEFLPGLPLGAPANRLGLAQWIVDPANPLASRVAVNRLWLQVFGRGIVRTAEDFGVQGSPPTHPLLLDTLAVRFMDSGWNVKEMLKTLVMSATYRQWSGLNDTLLDVDPDNRLYARAPRYRFSAEMVRDNALAASGLLSKQLGGPPAMPYQPPGLWEELAGGASQGPYVQGKGEDLYRRSLYTHRKRTVPHPTLTTFDAPSFEVCLARRARTNTPLQALALLNDTTYVEAARNLGQRMLTEVQGTPADRLDYGFRLVTGRHPTAAERASLVKGFDVYLARYSADGEAAAALVANGESPVPENLAPTDLAPYMTVAGVLLNLDEAITRE